MQIASFGELYPFPTVVVSYVRKIHAVSLHILIVYTCAVNSGSLCTSQYLARSTTPFIIESAVHNSSFNPF